ncbi:hypothetical protein Q0812_06455 [Brevundimonas sp. 2R-24]|uniref:Uncharacterized protein n=1 Tax=Peiella sedimenti TaxID=3061083 RepID=A0ABT8SMK6_9CAUL|nr:hypothetical protein [Caulobacteraceae bacterium XZ-24]
MTRFLPLAMIALGGLALVVTPAEAGRPHAYGPRLAWDAHYYPGYGYYAGSGYGRGDGYGYGDRYGHPHSVHHQGYGHPHRAHHRDHRSRGHGHGYASARPDHGYRDWYGYNDDRPPSSWRSWTPRHSGAHYRGCGCPPPMILDDR